MIVDCHTHIWPGPNDLGEASGFGCLCCEADMPAGPEQHRSACQEADFVLVLGFVCSRLDAAIPNAYLSEYVSQHRQRMVAFAGVDPTEPGSAEQVDEIAENTAFGGLTVAPGCQGFHPCDSRAMVIYEKAQAAGMPIYFLQGDRLPASAQMAHQQPMHYDEVAQSFPDLKIVISHMGCPWMDQMVALLAKHEHVYTDIAGLTTRPWQAYRALIMAYEYGVIEKLLFASDFPNNSVKDAVEAVYNLNKLTLDSVLPAIPREQLRGIVERESLSLLGLTPPALPQAGDTEDQKAAG